jgi:dephospho-CoA kinase
MPAFRPLLLTGGPAVGKTVTARVLAESTVRCAYIDVDDVRQLVKNGGAAPWDGEEGRAQHMLGVRNAAALAANFRADGCRPRRLAAHLTQAWVQAPLTKMA